MYVSCAGKVWHYRDIFAVDDVYRDTFESHSIWGRQPLIEDISGVFNAFGHTPVLRPHYVNLDSGCFLANRPNGGYGCLTALRFPEMELVVQENVE